eukprot:GFKZ01002159.1.p1 GENE.GFKZ01002159.1~~GFKZ01002159.1.p1  ORF type:complete len:118 (+),score=13.26 GFKZ01002159.1:163-516(+)
MLQDMVANEHLPENKNSCLKLCQGWLANFKRRWGLRVSSPMARGGCRYCSSGTRTTETETETVCCGAVALALAKRILEEHCFEMGSQSLKPVRGAQNSPRLKKDAASEHSRITDFVK